MLGWQNFCAVPIFCGICKSALQVLAARRNRVSQIGPKTYKCDERRRNTKMTTIIGHNVNRIEIKGLSIGKRCIVWRGEACLFAEDAHDCELRSQGTAGICFLSQGLSLSKTPGNRAVKRGCSVRSDGKLLSESLERPEKMKSPREYFYGRERYTRGGKRL